MTTAVSPLRPDADHKHSSMEAMNTLKVNTKCPAEALQAIYGPKSPDKQAALDASLQRCPVARRPFSRATASSAPFGRSGAVRLQPAAAAQSLRCAPHFGLAPLTRPSGLPRRWWRVYSSRKMSDPQEEYTANAMLYDPGHLPTSPRVPPCTPTAQATDH